MGCDASWDGENEMKVVLEDVHGDERAVVAVDCSGRERREGK